MPTDARSELEQIQGWMQSFLISPETNPVKASDFINDSRRLSAARHLNIYRQSYIARLRECMKNQFSALNYALGEELFQMFAEQYLDACPSASYTLNDLGKKFPSYLENTRPDAESEEKESWIDFIIALADFEYSLSEIFDQHAAEQIVLADDSASDEELKLVPVFHLFQHPYPVCRYYLDVVKKKNPELPFEEKTFCAVARCRYRLELLEINPAQYFFLEKILGGIPVEEAKIHTISEFSFDPKKFEILWQIWRKAFIGLDFFMINNLP